MAGDFVLRKAHTRRLHNGALINVRACYVWVPKKTSSKKPLRNKCPLCGAAINTRRMPNGGYTHTDAAISGQYVKHACLYPGEKLSRRRDSSTLDLFEETTSVES